MTQEVRRYNIIQVTAWTCLERGAAFLIYNRVFLNNIFVRGSTSQPHTVNGIMEALSSLQADPAQQPRRHHNCSGADGDIAQGEDARRREEDLQSMASTTSQSAAIVELHVSAVSLPSAIVGLCALEPAAPAVGAPLEYKNQAQEISRPYRDVVATHVYNVPPQEGPAVRLISKPRRPSTVNLNGCQRCPRDIKRFSGYRARSASNHSRRSRQIQATSSRSPPTTSPRRSGAERQMLTRTAQSAPTSRGTKQIKNAEDDPLSTTSHESGVPCCAINTAANGDGCFPPTVDSQHCYNHPRRALLHTAPGSTIARKRDAEGCPSAAAMQVETAKR